VKYWLEELIQQPQYLTEHKMKKIISRIVTAYLSLMEVMQKSIWCESWVFFMIVL